MATTHHEPHDESGHDHAHHVIPISLLIKVFGGLIVGMALTIVAAIYGPKLPVQFMWLIAMAIAYAKAFLVVQYFMGVKYTTKLVKAFAYGGFFWATLLLIMLTDYGTRQWEPVAGWTPGEESALSRDLEIDRVPSDVEIHH